MTRAGDERARRNRALSRLRSAITLGVWCCSLLLTGSAGAKAQCGTDHIDERVTVDHAYDGDTVTLRDGRRLRLIGVDTPELGRDGKPDQAYAVAARDALRGLLKEQGPELDLRLDHTRRDVYHRLLAHAFLRDGTSLSAWLLERGYGTLLIIPPNDWNARCYAAAEGRARADKAGVWALPKYYAIASTRLQKTARGYHLIEGRVTHVGKSAHSLWLDLEGGVAARIDRKDLDYFPVKSWADLVGKEVMVRGWVHPYRDEMQVRLRYPTDLEVTTP
ncbi:MAG: thermonuclease family protein [Gammaproteobacteria bacterium]